MQNNNQSLSKNIYTVSEITRDIKLILENTFGQVWVEGEISNFRPASSGHFYLTLKDEQAIISAAMFRGANRDLKFGLEDGLKVICFGKIDVYAPRGQYQLIIERIEPKGIGAQQLAFEQLKNKLAKEGMFDPNHKKELPLMPFCAGIVTSSAGAAVRDILQILKKGAPGVDVLIRSVRVQGETSAKEIALGIQELNEFGKADVIIVSRGGGSTEDLWSFNEEVVVRAIYNSKIPVISAVGHQINQTLSDLVADYFVETPSAAAKIIVDKKNSLLSEIDSLRHELGFAVSEILNRLSHNFVALRHMLKSPMDRLLEKGQFLDELNSSLTNNMRHCLNMTQLTVGSLIKRLDTLSPLSVLSRGYSLSTFVSTGEIVDSSEKLKPGDIVKTVLNKGAFISSVQEVIKNG
ncbi:MAG: exodeoxyribonuclease VII large subunit [Candidatus Omnitrophica bacterium]|nr:exodeoxyribonuclease VII large subunit [Candidatus Omnitrophota bacterium]